MSRELWFADAATVRAAFAARAVSPVEYMRAVLDRLDDCEPGLGAFITVDRDNAVAAAKAAERRITELGAAAFEGAPLLGIAVSVKDLIPTKGLRTTRGSALYRDWVPDFDPPVVDRLRRAGAILVGKTNTSEFGWSGSTRNRLVGATRNPWNKALTAGGSSGGAAAALAAGVGVAGIGTDGAGSVRIPASFCGVVGFKPSFGRVPYVPNSPENLSHIGPLTRTVDDAALLYNVIAGPDARDPFSLPAGDPAGLAGCGPLRIGWIPSPGLPEPEPDIEKAVASVVAALAAAGHVVDLVERPFADPYPALEAILATAEAAAHDDADAALIDPGRREVVELGRTVSGVELARANVQRAELTEQLRRLMVRYDVLAMPTVPILPFPVDADYPADAASKGRSRWLAWTPATYPFNLAGYPAISVPAGFTRDGMPIGLQLSGGWRADVTVLRVAKLVETLRPWQASYARLAARDEEGDPHDGDQAA